MTIAALQPLDRTSPTFRDDTDIFFATSLPAFVSQANALEVNVNGKEAAATAAAATATTKAGIAEAQANGSQAARLASEAARDLSQTYAAAAGAASGIPSLIGKGGKSLAAKVDETGVEWITPGFVYQVGDVHFGTQAPVTGTWLRCLGGVYLQSSYAALYAQLGLLANKPEAIGTWTSRTGAGTNYLGIAYGNGVWVTLNSPATSTDGVTWTPRSGATGATYVHFSNGIFVAVGTDVLFTSPDGITWTPRTISTGTWTASAYGNGKWVAISSTANKVAVSSDGVTWATQALATTGYSWRTIVFGAGLFVMTATGSNNTVALTSPDGVTWTPRTLPAAAEWEGLAFGNGKFVAINRTAGLVTTSAMSDDGIAWTAGVAPNGAWRCLVFGAGQFLAMTSNSATCWSSNDGVSWVSRSMTLSGAYCLAYGNGFFMAGTLGSATLTGCDPLFTYNLATQFCLPIQPVPTGLKSWIRAI